MQHHTFNSRVADWPSTIGIVCINKVMLHRCSLVLSRLTVRWYAILVCNQSPRPAQPPILCDMGNEYQPRGSGTTTLWLGTTDSMAYPQLWAQLPEYHAYTHLQDTASLIPVLWRANLLMSDLLRTAEHFWVTVVLAPDQTATYTPISLSRVTIAPFETNSREKGIWHKHSALYRRWCTLWHWAGEIYTN